MKNILKLKNELNNFYFIGSIALGGLVSLLICLDPLLSFKVNRLLPYSYKMFDLFPFLLSLGIIFLVLGSIYLLRFYFISEAAIATLFFALQFNGFCIGRVNPTDILFLLLLFVWGVKHLAAYNLNMVQSPLYLFFMGLVVIASMSGVNALSNRLYLSGMVTLIGNMAVAWLVMNYIKTRKQLRTAIEVLIIASVLTSIFAYVQFYSYEFFNNSKLVLGDELSWENTPFGLFLRPTGGQAQPNDLSHALVGISLIAFYFSISKIFSPKRRIYYFFCFLIMTWAIILSFTRADWMALVGGSTLILYFRFPTKALHLTLIFMMAIGIAFMSGLVEEILDFLVKLSTESVDVRGHLNNLGIEAFQKHPFLGIGINCFLMYPGNLYELDVHCTLLQAASQTGVFGLLMMSFILIFPLLRILNLRLKAKNAEDIVYLESMFLSFITFVVSIQFGMFFLFRTSWMYIALAETTALVFSDLTGKNLSQLPA